MLRVQSWEFCRRERREGKKPLDPHEFSFAMEETVESDPEGEQDYGKKPKKPKGKKK
jgi:hypothetical protein